CDSFRPEETMLLTELPFPTFVIEKNGRNRTEPAFFLWMPVLLQLVDKPGASERLIFDSPSKAVVF
ncbi:MAG TPA: hypothetical protein VJQ25_11995, partial [Nitrospira sp.]|nr:hypothetical protein [Nitrospira sp.]